MPTLYLAILDYGNDIAKVTYWGNVEHACDWIEKTLANTGARTIEHASHIPNYVNEQGGYHASSVKLEDSPVDYVQRPYVSISKVYAKQT